MAGGLPASPGQRMWAISTGRRMARAGETGRAGSRPPRTRASWNVTSCARRDDKHDTVSLPDGQLHVKWLVTC
jgi:hypothetical protein